MNLMPVLPSDRLTRHLLSRPPTRPLADWEREAADTARRVSFRFGLSGLRWGESGPVALMLHGWAGRPTQFASLVPPLLAAGRQVIALDAPGHGESPGQTGTLMEFVLTLHEAAAEIRNLESVVGHSMGGAAAALAVAQGLPADRAVLFAAPSSIDRQLRGIAERVGLGRRGTDRVLRRMENANGVPVGYFEIPGRVAGMEVPLQVVHDRSDRQVPFEEGERIAAAWPGAELISTDGLGHGRVLSDPDVVRRVTAFLVGRRPRPQ